MASLGFKYLMKYVLNNDMMLAVQMGGVLMALAAFICFIFIKERKDENANEHLVTELEIREERSV
jgi:maltose/moltooligosaccharide transporter